MDVSQESFEGREGGVLGLDDEKKKIKLYQCNVGTWRVFEPHFYEIMHFKIVY